MIVMRSLGDFIFSTWLWGATISWVQLFFSLCMIIVFLRVIVGVPLMSAIAQAFLLQLISFWFFTLIAVGFVMHICCWEYVTLCNPVQLKQIAPFQACFALAVVYSVFNSALICIMNLFRRFSLFGYLLGIWVSQLSGAFIGYIWIVLFLWRIL